MTTCVALAACGSSGSSAAGSGGSAAGGSAAGGGASSAPNVDTSIPPALSALYTKAKAEGSVTWSWPYAQSQAQPIIDAFEKTFPGVSVSFTDVKPNTLLTQLQLQVKAGKVTQDVAPANVTSVAPTIKDGVVQTGTDWASLGVPADDIFNKDLVVGLTSLGVIFYNKNSLSAADAPKSWDDLLNPKFAGKIAVDGRASSWIDAFYINQSLGGEAGGLAYAKKIAAQKLSYQTSTESILPIVSSGQFTLGTGLLNQVLTAIKTGAPLAIAPISPVHAQNTYAFVVKNAPHPAAAELLTAWLASPAGQEAADAAFSTTLPPATQCPPANDTAQWKAACDNKLSWKSLTTLSAFKAEGSFNTAVQKLFGTYTGKGG